MRVDRLALKDFRGIGELTLNFPEQVTVLAGANGSGKSTILEGLATLLARIGTSLIPNARSQRGVSAGDIRNGSEVASLTVHCSGRLGNPMWELRVTKTLSRVSTRWDADELKHMTSQLRNELSHAPSTPVPFASYYRTNRAVLDIPLRIRTRHTFDQFSVFEDALDSGWGSFRLFFEWFRYREDIENEARARGAGFTDPQLAAVRLATSRLLPDFSDLKVQRQPLRMTVKKYDAELDVAQLSDGEKCLLAMVADIARRLAIANPASKTPCEERAIILIDEIELHLHPTWQRHVVQGLTTAFPYCQFVVTTHSPQVLSTVKPKSIYLLGKQDGAVVTTHPQSSYGRQSNQILTELMGTPDRPEDIRAELDRMFDLIDAGQIEAAQAARDSLAKDIGADEPEFVRADIAIRLRDNK